MTLTAVVQPLEVMQQGGENFLRRAKWVDARVLAANTPELHTVPTGAKFVVFAADVGFYAKFMSTAEAADLVTNGAFAADASWTKGTGWTIAAGVANSDASQSANSDLSQTPTVALVQGQAYLVTFTTSTVTGGNVRAVIGGTAGTNRSTSATFSEIIIAGSGTDIAIRGDLDFAGNVDDFSVIPCAQVPSADILTGTSSEYSPNQRYLGTDENFISLVASATCVVTMSFFGN